MRNLKLWYTVSYDISSDKIRRRVEKICSSYMQRVQYSVFEGYLSAASFRDFYEKLQEECKKSGWESESDSILIYKHCTTCHENRMVLGKKLSYSKNYFII